MTKNSFRERWDRFFFRPSSALNLAVVRIVVGLMSLWMIFSRDLPATSSLPQVFWEHVPMVARWRFLIFPGHEPLERGIQRLAVLCLTLFVFGVWTSFTALISALLLYHLAPMETIFWNPNPYLRGLTIPILALVALSIAPCGHRLSLEGLWRRPTKTADASEYGWAIRFVQIQIVFIYFFSGYSKLLDVGWRWLNPATMRLWLLALNQNQETRVFHTLGPWAAEHAWLCFAMGTGSLFLELLFPVVLVSDRASRVLLPTAFAMHVGIVLALNITILFIPLYVAFVDWEGLARRWRKSPRAATLPLSRT